MRKIGVPRRLKGESAANILKQVPILRGWEGIYEAEDWMTVGTGRKREAIGLKEKEFAAVSTDTIEEVWGRWAEQLSEEYVLYVRRTKFIRYECPHCSGHI
jgi:ABC-type sugar transport system substrate-binding protein